MTSVFVQEGEAGEAWRPVVGLEGFYEVSDHGRVRSVDRTIVSKAGITQRYKGRILKPRRARGYRSVQLNRNGEGYNFYVHRLVLAAFVGTCPDGMETRHMNGDPADNRLGNLRYGTSSENTFDRVRHGTHQEARKTHCPRGHRLADPNLRASAKRRGRRNCLACGRAAAYISRRKELKPFRKEIADKYYEKIMGGK